ncbi:hypothetical protein MMC10_000877 [Thelotrema lepadinum]|nr:hypothetical protein [Thelotrema lepadinum]
MDAATETNTISLSASVVSAHVEADPARNLEKSEHIATSTPVPTPLGGMPKPETSLQPTSSDPADDYSTFTPRQRIIIISIASVVGLLSPLSSNLYVPAIPAVARDLGVTTNAVNLTITSYLIFQGLSPTLWSAIGDSVGRRPLYVAMLSIYLLSCLGLALSQNYATLIALRAIQAMGSASTTAVGAGLISDLIHVSRRGKYMGNYSALAGLSTALGPVLGGVFAQYTGWRGIFYFLVGLTGFLVLLVILLLPETMRKIVSDGHVSTLKMWRPPIKCLDAPKTSSNYPSGFRGNHFSIDFRAPTRLLREPEILCCVMFTGVCYTVWQMTMVATATLYSERYSLSEFHIGLTYISNGIGSLCGSVITGRTLNWYYKKQLKRDTRARNSEEEEVTIREVQRIELARIKPAIIPTIGFLISVVAFGWTVQHNVHIAIPISLSFFIGGLDTVILATFCKFILQNETSGKIGC